LALTQGPPSQVVGRGEGPQPRQVEIWNVASLRLSATYTDAVRVVRVRERWTERTRRGKQWQTEPKEQNWIWVVAGELDAYDGARIRDLGHLRWKIENNAFCELTQHGHLTHCAHHKPVALVALLWIKIIAFTLFHAFAILHGKLFRWGKVTLQELRKRIYRSLLCGWPIRCFSGGTRQSRPYAVQPEGSEIEASPENTDGGPKAGLCLASGVPANQDAG
jgi:hypothetical protein